MTQWTLNACVLASACCVVLGDILTALWAKSGSRAHMAGAWLFLLAGCAGYFPAIRAGGMARVVALGSTLAALGAVLAGVFALGESLSPRQALGAAFAVLAIALLSW